MRASVREWAGRSGCCHRVWRPCAQLICPRLLLQRVLLFVASDVDALCACKILQVSFEYLRKIEQGREVLEQGWPQQEMGGRKGGTRRSRHEMRNPKDHLRPVLGQEKYSANGETSK